MPFLTVILTFIPMMAPADGAEGGAGGLLSFLPFILIFVIMYFLLIRPQAKKQKEQQKMIQELKQGDEVVTIGGIHGSVAGLRDQDNTVILKIGENHKITIDRAAVSRKVESGVK